MPGRRPLLAGLVAGTALAVLSPFAAAQGGQWPERAIRVIVPFPPSGATDLDVAAVLAVRQAAPFPPPPRGGTISVRFSYTRE
jgi:hypothetical protein